MSSINYLKVYEDGTKEATKFKPIWGLGDTRTQAGENPDVFIDGKWFNSSNGVELVNNGTFDTDVSGWTTNGDGLTSWSNGTMISQRSASVDRPTYQTLVLEVGKNYTVVAEMLSQSGSTTLRIEEGTVGGITTEYIIPNIGKNTFNFTCKNSISLIVISMGGSTTATSQWDNISVFETEIMPDTQYISQPTYLSQNGKLLEVEVNNGVPSTLQANEDAPKIVEECIQVSKVIQTENRKIIELGTIFNNNRYVIDNPFGNENYEDCDVKMEVYINGEWGESKPMNTDSSNYYGTNATSMLIGIVIQTSEDAVSYSTNNRTGNGFLNPETLTSAPARVIVTYVGEAK